MAQGQQNYISGLVNAYTELIRAYDKLELLRRDFDALGYSGTFTPEDMDAVAAGWRTVDDGQGNQVSDVAIITNAVSTFDAIDTLVSAGHLTNIKKLLEPFNR